MAKINFLQFLQDSNGDNSSKRLGGIFCLAQGSLMKLGLFYYSLNHKTVTSFEKLDGCADSLIYVGAGLLGWGVIEHFSQKEGNKNKNSK